MIDKEILEDDLRILKRDFSEHFWEIVALTEMFLSGKLVEPMSKEEIEDILYSVQNETGSSHLISPDLCSSIAEVFAGKVGKQFVPASPKEITKIIAESSLWNCGKDSHNALSELVCSLSGKVGKGKEEK